MLRTRTILPAIFTKYDVLLIFRWCVLKRFLVAKTCHFSFQTIKNVIFSLLGSKLPAEDFQENPENKSAWKGYLGAVANALRKLA